MEILDLNLLDSGRDSHVIEGEGEKLTQSPPSSKRLCTFLAICGCCLSIWGQTGAGRKDDGALQGPPTK